MNAITVSAGALICGYAAWVFAMRVQGKDDRFKKLEPMRRFWGPRLGSAIHFTGYVGAPLAVGVALIIAGIKGIDLLTLLK